MNVGNFVICSYRMPSVLQPWIHEIYVGVVEEADTDPHHWNGSNSEQQYCETTGTVRVRYSFGVCHDRADSLTVITEEESRYTFREKIGYFLGRVALTNYDRACGMDWEMEAYRHSMWNYLTDVADRGDLQRETVKLIITSDIEQVVRLANVALSERN